MQITDLKISQVIFKQIRLTKAEEKIVRKNLAVIVKTGVSNETEQARTSLFEIFDKYFQIELSKYSKLYMYKEDFLQNIYLRFFELLNQIQEKTLKPMDFLNEINKGLKPIKDDKVGFDKSLNSYIIEGSKNQLIDTLTNEDIPIYASPKSPKEKDIINKKVETLLQETLLKEKEKRALQGKKQGKTFRILAKEEKQSATTIRYNLLAGISKLQLKENALPKEIIDLGNIYKLIYRKSY